MADLSDLQATEAVRLVGATVTGAETYPVKVSPVQEMAVQDTIAVAGVQGAMTINNTLLEVKVGATRLANRKSVTIFNNSSHILYWGFTTATSATTGTPLHPMTFMSFAIGDNPIYIITTAADLNANIRITES